MIRVATALIPAWRRDLWIAVSVTGLLFGAYAVSSELLRQQPIEQPLRLLTAVLLPLLVAPGAVAVAHASASEGRLRPWTLAVLATKLHATVVAVLVLVGAGLLLFVVPGIVAAILSVYAVPAVAVDRDGPVDAILASAQAATDRFWDSVRVLGVVVAALVLSTLVAGSTVEAARAIEVHPLVGVALAGTLAGLVLSSAFHWLVLVYEEQAISERTERPA